MGIKLDAIYSSPLERALETAETIARKHEPGGQEEFGVEEIDFGDWTGKTFRNAFE